MTFGYMGDVLLGLVLCCDGGCVVCNGSGELVIGVADCNIMSINTS